MSGQNVDAARGPAPLCRVLLAAAWLAVPAWVLISRWDTVLAGHPAYLVLLLASLAVGVLLAATARRARTHRSRVWRVVLGLLAVLGSVVALGATAWLRPFAATPEAIAITSIGTDTVSVESSATTITLTPQQPGAEVGVIVQPGARVDPRAYVPLWSRVSAQGYLVVIVKQPLAIGFLAIGAPASIQDDHPDVGRWALSGHSLGGVAGSQFAAGNPDRADGVVFWASYPLDSLADRDDLVVASVSGSADGLATPDDIDASRADLPPDTTFTVVDGAVHAFFGDYGEQPGDGTPTTSRAEAQDAIVSATLDALAEIAER